jgi:hypothetical protein
MMIAALIQEFQFTYFIAKIGSRDALQLHLCESTWEMTQHWKLLAWRYEVHHDGGVKTH